MLSHRLIRLFISLFILTSWKNIISVRNERHLFDGNVYLKREK